MCLDMSVANTYKAQKDRMSSDDLEKLENKNSPVQMQSFAHHVYDHPPECLLLFLREVLEDVTVVFLQQFEAHSQVVVFQH